MIGELHHQSRMMYEITLQPLIGRVKTLVCPPWCKPVEATFDPATVSHLSII